MSEPHDSVRVLMYHQIDVATNRWERNFFVNPRRFRDQMQRLLAAGFRLCSLPDFCAWAAGQGVLPPKSVLLTFDDGYRGVYEHAASFLIPQHLPFAVFAVSALTGGADHWLAGLNVKRYPLMSRAELIELAQAGVGIGSHSRHHADLPTLSPTALYEELYGSRCELENMLGHRIDCFAYPYGRANDAVKTSVLRAGYRFAFSTRSGVNNRLADPLMIRRIDVYGSDTPAMLVRKLQFGTNDGSLIVAGRYYASRAAVRLGFRSSQWH